MTAPGTNSAWDGIQFIASLALAAFVLYILAAGGISRVKNFALDLWYGPEIFDDDDDDDPDEPVYNGEPDAPLTKREPLAPRTEVSSIPAFAVEFRLWWRKFLKDAVHVMLVGETNAGKSTAGRAIARTRIEMGHKVLIIDIHTKKDTWHGALVIGGKRNFAQVEAVFKHISLELARRYEIWGDAYEGDDLSAELYPVTIIMDEVPAVMKACPSAAAVIKDIAREGRKVNMFLILLTQSDRVKTLNIEGEGDVRQNFWYLYLGDKAVEQDKRCRQLKYPAFLRTLKSRVPVDTVPLGQMSKAGLEDVGHWDLISLEEVTPGQERQKQLPPPAHTIPAVPDRPLKRLPAASSDPAVAALISGGYQAYQVAELLGGSRALTLERAVAALPRVEEVLN